MTYEIVPAEKAEVLSQSPVAPDLQLDEVPVLDHVIRFAEELGTEGADVLLGG